MTMSSRIYAAALAIGLSVAPVLAADEATDAAGDVAQRFPSIYVVAAERSEIVDRVIASGYVRPVEEVYVQPEIEGLAIEGSDIEIGDTVEKGQVMARLSRDSLQWQKMQIEANVAKADAALEQYKAQVAEAQAAADEAVRVRDRYETLSKNGTIPRAQYEQAKASATGALARLNSAKLSLKVGKADIEVARTQLEDLNLKLSRTQVKAPVAGVVSGKNLKVGAIATGASGPMFTIIRDGELELRADLSEQDILKVKAGQQVLVRPVGQTQPVAGTVRLVEPTIDMTTRLAGVRISFNDPDQVRSGMFADAEIVVQSKMATIVPVPTVKFTDGRSSVLKVSDGQVATTEVETGIRSDGMVEIVRGVEAGDLMVAKAGAFVRDGDRINPVPVPDAVSAESAAVIQ